MSGTLLSFLATTLSKDIAVTGLLERIEMLDETWYGPRDVTSPIQPLLTVARDPFVLTQANEIAAARKALLAVPATSLAVIARFLALASVQEMPLLARRTGDTDPAAYLAAGIETAETLFAALILPEIPGLIGIRTILLNPDLDREGRIAQILALSPQAADLCSYHLADGAHPDVTDRFYSSRSHVDTDGDWVVVDRDTNRVVQFSKWARWSDAVAKAMNAQPAIGAALAEIADRREALRPQGTEAEFAALRAEEQAQFDALGEATRAWRASGGLGSFDPWSPKQAA